MSKFLDEVENYSLAVIQQLFLSYHCKLADLQALTDSCRQHGKDCLDEMEYLGALALENTDIYTDSDKFDLTMLHV